MSTAEVVSNSIKNGILFVLIILIVHFAVKSTVEHRHSTERFVSSSSSSSSSSRRPIRPVPISDAANNADLMDYVFGGVSNVAAELQTSASEFKKFIESPVAPSASSSSSSPSPSSMIPIEKKKVEPPAPPPLPVDTGVASEGLSEGGFYVYNKFQNESVLCGGSIYPDVPNLQGFDGKMEAFSSLV